MAAVLYPHNAELFSGNEKRSYEKSDISYCLVVLNGFIFLLTCKCTAGCNVQHVHV